MASASIIDGKAIAAEVRRTVAEEGAAFDAETGRRPGLATVLIGDDPASAIYVGGKQKASREVGIEPFDERHPADTSREEVVAIIERLNASPEVSGIIVQLPLPGHLDGTELTGLVRAGKDVDGLTPASAGLLALGRPGLRPCTPAGRSEEHTSELQSRQYLVCRLLLEKKTPNRPTKQPELHAKLLEDPELVQVEHALRRFDQQDGLGRLVDHAPVSELDRERLLLGD